MYLENRRSGGNRDEDADERLLPSAPTLPAKSRTAIILREHSTVEMLVTLRGSELIFADSLTNTISTKRTSVQIKASPSHRHMVTISHSTPNYRGHLW